MTYPRGPTTVATACHLESQTSESASSVPSYEKETFSNSIEEDAFGTGWSPPSISGLCFTSFAGAVVATDIESVVSGIRYDRPEPQLLYGARYLKTIRDLAADSYSTS